MPRKVEFESRVVAAPKARAVVSAATRMTMRSGDDKSTKSDNAWQKRAWLWYDVIGEYRYACSWVGNLLSRAGLYVAYDGKPTTNTDAIEAMVALFGGEEGQREMLRQLGIQFTVAGEAYIVGEDGGNDPTDKWWIVAASEITNSGGVWKVNGKEVSDPLVIRLWRPHPKDSRKPDSPSRAVLPILAEIDGLTKHVAAQIDSRLAGAGLLLLPDNISFAASSQTEGDSDALAGDLDTFVMELMETMKLAIANREDASALVPIIVQAPGEHLDKVRHLTFSTELDKQAIELRKEAIRRLSLGMDMPPEVLTGTGDINHWGAWQIEEAGIKAHTEPLLHVITDSLTMGYLRPYLEETMDPEEARRYSIMADTSAMRLRPNRSKEAIELYDRGMLSMESTVRENGFDEADIMGDDERQAFFTQKVASGSTTPELVAEALRMLGLPFTVPSPETIAVQEARPTRSLIDHPENNPPDPAKRRPIADGDAAAAEVIVFRALERAGNRIRSKYRDKISMGAENVPPHTLYRFTQRLDPNEVDDVMMDAWSCLASLPPIPITAETLDQYARMLIKTNKPHDSAMFRDYLNKGF